MYVTESKMNLKPFLKHKLFWLNWAPDSDGWKSWTNSVPMHGKCKQYSASIKELCLTIWYMFAGRPCLAKDSFGKDHAAHPPQDCGRRQGSRRHLHHGRPLHHPGAAAEEERGRRPEEVRRQSRWGRDSCIWRLWRRGRSTFVMYLILVGRLDPWQLFQHSVLNVQHHHITHQNCIYHE